MANLIDVLNKYNPLKIFNPVGYAIESTVFNAGKNAGAVVASNVMSGQNPLKNLGDVLSRPAAPLVINQPPKQGLDALGIGFVEKNVIIIGLLALGAFAIYRKVK